MEYIKINELTDCDPQEVKAYLEEAKEKNKKLYLCKICSRSFTMNESGICNGCEKIVNSENLLKEYDDDQKLYFEMLKNRDNIEIVEDL